MEYQVIVNGKVVATYNIWGWAQRKAAEIPGAEVKCVLLPKYQKHKC